MEKWKLYAILSMVFAGLTSVVAKFGMKNLSSDVALSIRTFVVFAIVSANALLFTNIFQQLKQSPKSNLVYLAISGVTTSLSWIFYYRAIKEGQVSYVAAIDKASIIITLILSFIFLHEQITPKIMVGASLIFIGMIVLVWK